MPAVRDDRIRQRSDHHYGWSVTVRNDGFTGEVTCYIASRQTYMQNRITYADGALGFQFDKHVNTARTWFRVDDQPARKWTSVFAELNARHIAVRPLHDYNQTATLVLIPLDEIGDGQAVYIRASDDDKPKRFRLTGFREAKANAEANGCTEDSFRRPDF